jgi:hypothetical protein
MNSISGVLIRLSESTLELNDVLVYGMFGNYFIGYVMNERIIEIAIEAGFNPVNCTGSNVPLFEKFAELIVKDCLSIARQQRHNMQCLASNPPQSAAAYDIERNIMNHFGVE